MRLDDKEFKELKALSKKAKLTDEEKVRLAELKKKKGSGGKRGSGDDKFVPGNDFSWWNKYPVLTNGSANLPFNWFPGTSLLHTRNLGTREAPSGALRVNFYNVYGSEDEITGPINMTARNLYLAMHRKFRGISTYEPADVGMVLIATVELISFIARIERIYGVINRYNVLNRNLPSALLRAMHVSENLAQNIRMNLADFRTGLNMRLMRAQNIVCPKDLSVVADKLSLYSYVYSDHIDAKAQAIIFDCDQIGIYDPTTISTGGSIKFTGADFTGFTTYDQILGILDVAINALVNDTDTIRIYADMLAYIGPEQLLNILPVPEDYKIAPVYSESILHKFHNMMELPYTFDFSTAGKYSWYSTTTPFYTWPTSVASGTVWQADNRIVQHDGIICTKLSLVDVSGDYTVGSVTMDGNTYHCWIQDSGTPIAGVVTSTYNLESVSLLDTYRQDPSLETVMEGVLWKYGLKTVHPSSTTDAYIIDTVAFEVCSAITSYGFDNATQQNVDSRVFLNICDADQTSSMSATEYRSAYSKLLASSAAELSAFDWAPFIYLFYRSHSLKECEFSSNTNTNSEFNAFPVIGDMCNVRVVTNSDIKPIQSTAVYSGFATNVAVIGEDNKPR